MTEFFGEFDPHLPPSQEYLQIQFSPSSLPIQQRWRNNGLSANFMADFLLAFFPDCDRTELQGTICYIANELLENAMKFTDEGAIAPISITLYLQTKELVFVSTNSVIEATQQNLLKFIHRLENVDLKDLYLAQLEQSVTEEHPISAGMGILTMLNDYNAKLGWKLEQQEDSKIAIVTTMVKLPL
jgi:hypothetical protein